MAVPPSVRPTPKAFAGRVYIMSGDMPADALPFPGMSFRAS
jgi:hypothetical protein